MARFIFNLEGVLRQREHLEQMLQRELADIQSQATALAAQLAAMNESIRKTADDVKQNRLVGTIDLAFLAAHRRYSFAMERKAMVLAQEMVAVEKMKEAKRLELAAAARARKAIEKLRERQFDRWKADQAQREMAQMDEIAMQLSYQHGVTVEAAAREAQNAQNAERM